jgi:hypothetical protein
MPPMFLIGIDDGDRFTDLGSARRRIAGREP